MRKRGGRGGGTFIVLVFWITALKKKPITITHNPSVIEDYTTKCLVLARFSFQTSVSAGAGRGQHSRPQHQYQTWERTSASSESSSSASDAAAPEFAGAAEGAWREPFHLWPGDRRCQTVLGKEERWKRTWMDAEKQLAGSLDLNSTTEASSNQNSRRKQFDVSYST